MIDERRQYVRAERTLRVYRGGNRTFSFTRDGAGKGRSSNCGSPDEIQSAVDLLNAAVARLAVTTVDWNDRYQAERDAAIADVVLQGSVMFEAIAADDSSRTSVRALLNGAVYLETQADLHVPWEWLYLGDRNASPDLQQFLGASRAVGYNICSRTPVETEDPDDVWLRYARLPSNSTLRINIAENKILKSAAHGIERGSIADTGHTIQPLRDLLKGKPSEILAFGNFMKAEHNIAHFNAHALGNRSIKHPELIVSKSFPVSTKDIEQLRPFYPDSVVVLNCCNGLALHWGPESTLAAAFLEGGGETVLATTSQIEDTYATSFITEFYKYLLNGECVGRALISARRRTLVNTGNPACLAYGIIGPFLKRVIDRDAA